MISLLYIHGLGGHENGNASTLVKDELEKRSLVFTLDAPQFPVTEPERMKAILLDNINKYDFFIASSLGAFHSMQIDGVKKILVNPALPENLEKLGDEQVTPALLEELYEERNAFFKRVEASGCKDETFFIFGKGDTLAPNSAFFREKFGRSITPNHFISVEMGHRMESSGAVAVSNIISQKYK